MTLFIQLVVEHIQKLDKAISEMYRLLNPGGLMMHHLNPIWSENGGHALGTLDSPWLHVVLKEKEFERYLKEIHPFESDIAIPWTKKSLNRRITINSLQRLLIKMVLCCCIGLRLSVIQKI